MKKFAFLFVCFFLFNVICGVEENRKYTQDGFLVSKGGARLAAGKELTPQERKRVRKKIQEAFEKIHRLLQKKKLTPKEQREMEETFRFLDDFPGCVFCYMEKCDIHLAADRKLTPKERKEMDAAIQVLLDRKRKLEERKKAAEVLGYRIAHQEAIEPLKRIAFNKREERELRYWAVTALSLIADKRVIPLLIDLAIDDKVGGRAAEQLRKLTGMRLPPGIEPMKKGEKWRDWWTRNKVRYHKAWLNWWEKNKGTFVFNRLRAMVEY